MRRAFVLVLACVLACGSDKNPTGPGQSLIGNWVVTDAGGTPLPAANYLSECSYFTGVRGTVTSGHITFARQPEPGAPNRIAGHLILSGTDTGQCDTAVSITSPMTAPFGAVLRTPDPHGGPSVVNSVGIEQPDANTLRFVGLTFVRQ